MWNMGDCIGHDSDEMIVGILMVPDDDLNTVKDLPLVGPWAIWFDPEVSAWKVGLTQPVDITMVAALIDQTWGRKQ